MGQIVARNAKAKRCNVQALQGTLKDVVLAAGEYMLVSTDNSMTEDGQGNFDGYIVGDGSTKAMLLPLRQLASDMELEGASIDVSGLTLYNYYVTDSLKWNTSVNNKHVALQVSEGERYLVKANPSQTTVYCFLTANTYSNGGAVPLVTGTSKNYIRIGGTSIVTIPAGCQYLYMYGGNANTGTGRDSLPESVIRLERLTDRVRETENGLLLGKNICVAGSDNTGSKSAYYRGFVGGHTYRVFIKDKNIDMSSVTSNSSYFRLWFVLRKESDGSESYAGQPNVYMGTALKDYYDLIIPSDDIYSLQIGMRASKGAEQVFVIEDVTEIEGIEAEISDVRSESLAGLLESDAYVEVDLPTTGTRYFSFSVNGTAWGTNNTYRHMVVHVGDADYVAVTANDSYGARVAWLTDAAFAASGASMPLVSGTLPFVAAPAGETRILKVPAGAVTLAFYKGSSSSGEYVPARLVKYCRKGEYSGDEAEVEAIVSTGVNPGTAASGTAATNASTRTRLFPVESGALYKVSFTKGNVRMYGAFYTRMLGVGTSMGDGFYYIYESITDGSFESRPSADGYYAFWCYPSPDFEISVRRIESGGELASELRRLKRIIDDKLPFEEVAVSSYTRYSRQILLAGWWGNSTSDKHMRIPVDGGQYVKVVANSDRTAQIAFLTPSASASSNYTKAGLVEGTVRHTVPASDYGIFQVPEGTGYLYVFTGEDNNYLPSFIGLADSGSVSETGNVTDIVSKNNEVEMSNKIRQMHRAKGNNAIDQLVMVHFSDIHDDLTALKRVDSWYRHYKSFIDDVIHTGDTVMSNVENEYANPLNATGEELWAAAGVEKYLNVVGNHDAAHSGNTATTAKESCDKVIAPYVEAWRENGVVIGDDVCYYYKDYASQNVRLIVIDEYHYDAAQDTWLANTLADALSNGRHVLMASHSSNGGITEAECTFAREAGGSGTGTIVGNSEQSKSRVQDFIDRGGNFICWLCGHAHYDTCGWSKSHSDQFRIVVSCASPHRATNYNVDRTKGYKQEDCFNVISVDTLYKVIRVMRVGADYDRYMRHQGSFCYDYGTRKIISNN